MSILTTLIVSVLFLGSNADAARILAIFPWPAYSHQAINHLISMSLAKKGHELIVFTPNPTNIQLANYTEHSLKYLYPMVHTKMNYVTIGKGFATDNYKALGKISAKVADAIFSDTQLKEYTSPSSTKKFDLVIIGSSTIDSLYHVANLVDAPLIAIVTSPGYAFNHFEIGNPTHPAWTPDVMAAYSNEMNFQERISNLLLILRQWYNYHYIGGPMHDEVLRKHFGNDAPSTEEVRQRISMMFLNTHPVIHYPRPMNPNILQIAGLRMGMMNKTLPDDIKSILDNAKQGFIYFSLGSNVNSTDLGPVRLKRIIDVFSGLPYLILWKFNENSIPNQPSNLLLRKWLPQPAVLGHPNIKLFIYQGGLQSTEEAIECGVPLLGIPMVFDQFYNVESLRRKGVAETLDILEINKDELRDKILQLVTNSKYKENMEKLRSVFCDRPEHPLDAAIWWSEFLIRHKDNSFFQPPRLPWYQHHMFDIYGFFIAVFLILFYIFYKLLQFVIVSSMTNKGYSSRSNKMKNS